MFKKLEEKLSMLSRVMKDTNGTFRDEKLQCLRVKKKKLELAAD